MRISPSVTLVASALALLVLPTSAHAQFGKLVKKAKEAVAADKAANTPAAVTSATTPSTPVQINPGYALTRENLDRFTLALETDRATRQETMKLFAGMKTPQAFALCSQSAGMSPGYQQIFNRYVEDAPKAKDAEATAAVAKKFTDDATAYMLTTCGLNPGDYPAHQREATARTKGFDAGIEKSGLERRNYAVMIERVVPFCTADAATRAATDVKVPGTGRNIFFVYLPAESAELAPRCDRLMSALQSVS